MKNATTHVESSSSTTTKMVALTPVHVSSSPTHAVTGSLLCGVSDKEGKDKILLVQDDSASMTKTFAEIDQVHIKDDKCCGYCSCPVICMVCMFEKECPVCNIPFPENWKLQRGPLNGHKKCRSTTAPIMRFKS